jgi:hypothetical protein
MIPAPLPPDDEQGVRALHALLNLDTPPEERFDRVCGSRPTIRRS